MSVWNMFGKPGYVPGSSPRRTTTQTDPFAPGPISGTGVPYGDLAAALNEFMAQQAKQQFISNLPDYASMVAQRSQTTGQQLRGEVPSDVISQLLQHGAEGGAGRGFAPGSPNTNSAYLRALGLTSIGQQEAGSKNLSQSIADTPISPLFNPASLFVPERLGMLGLGAAQAGLNRQPGNYGGGGSTGGGSSAATPRFGGAAGVSGMPWGPGGAPGPSSKGWNLPGDPFADQLYSDEQGIDWTGYSPFGNEWNDPNANIYQPAMDQGPSDFSDWYD